MTANYPLPTPLDDVLNTFSFLLSDYGFTIVETRYDKHLSGAYLIIFRNDNSKLQLEISADSNYFHCEIRRLINGQPAKYNDEDNCIGFEDLAILESNNNYEHLDYFAGGKNELQGVLKTTAALFQRHKLFFTTDCWIDTKRIEALRDEDFERKFGIKPLKDKPTYFKLLKIKASEYLSEKGFVLTVDSEELPPYDSSKITEHIIFQKENKEINITAKDWRDDYYIYLVKLNGNIVFEIDTSQYKNVDIPVVITMDKLKHII